MIARHVEYQYSRFINQNIAGPHVLIDSEAGLGYPTATKAMMAGYDEHTLYFDF